MGKGIRNKAQGTRYKAQGRFKVQDTRRIQGTRHKTNSRDKAQEIMFKGQGPGKIQWPGHKVGRLGN
jgi:hypothetical protein